MDDRLTADDAGRCHRRRGRQRTSRKLRPLVRPAADRRRQRHAVQPATSTPRRAGRRPGYLRAKTGSLTGTNSLAGIVTDASGRVLTFALISNNAGPTGRTSIDALAAKLRSCGCSG